MRATQALIDPVCFLTCYPQLLYNFVYRVPKAADVLGSLTGILGAARFLFSRDLIIAEVALLHLLCICLFYLPLKNQTASSLWQPCQHWTSPLVACLPSEEALAGQGRNYYTLFLPRGKVRLQASCSKGCQDPTPCWSRQIQARPNQPWAWCSVFIPPPASRGQGRNSYQQTPGRD
jgi:hypothetical protein